MGMKQKLHRGKYKWLPATALEKELAVQHTKTELKLHLYKAIDSFEATEYALDLTPKEVEDTLLDLFMGARRDNEKGAPFYSKKRKP